MLSTMHSEQDILNLLSKYESLTDIISTDSVEKNNDKLKCIQDQLECLTEELSHSKLLQQISSQLIEQDNIEKLYEHITEAAKKVMSSDAASLQVYVPEKKTFSLLSWRGFHPKAAEFWQSIALNRASICSKVIKQRKRIIIDNIETCDFLHETENCNYRLCDIRSLQATPLISRSGELLGMITTHWQKLHRPSERQFALLDVIMRQAADLLDRMRVQTVLRENESWMNGQIEAFQAAMNGRPLSKSLQPLIDTIVRHTNGEARAAFYIISPGCKDLRHLVGMSESYAADTKACGLAMHTEKNVITVDVEEDPKWKPFIQIARKYNYRACWSFPVKIKGATALGTLSLYFQHPREPVARELELAALLTHAASIIISRNLEHHERAQAEKALRKREKELKMLIRLREEFIGNASHELNTPLTNMMIYTEMLEHYCKKNIPDEYSDMIKKLSLQAHRLDLLIRDMLDTTRLTEGKLLLAMTYFDLNQLIRKKVEDLQIDTKKYNLTLKLMPLREVEADEERIGQVITNFVSNAVKYSPLGGDIVISSSLQGDLIQVSVADSGIGIPQKSLNKIFERFYRVNTSMAKTFPGMGIGLSICKEIITLHHGKVSVESIEKEGSVFSFFIPMTQQKIR